MKEKLITIPRGNKKDQNPESQVEDSIEKKYIENIIKK